MLTSKIQLQQCSSGSRDYFPNTFLYHHIHHPIGVSSKQKNSIKRSPVPNNQTPTASQERALYAPFYTKEMTSLLAFKICLCLFESNINIDSTLAAMMTKKGEGRFFELLFYFQIHKS